MTGLAHVLVSEAVYDASVDIAEGLIKLHLLTANQISAITHLDIQTVLELAADLGVILPDGPVTPPTLKIAFGTQRRVR